MMPCVTDDASNRLQAILERYRAAGNPERTTWLFDRGVDTVPHRELELAGLLERVFGTPHGFAWRLTAAGVSPQS